MPDLPNVETFCRYLDPTASHQHIRKVEVVDEAVLRKMSFLLIVSQPGV